MKRYFLIGLLGLFSISNAQETKQEKGVLAPKPMFRDPIYDGAADPVVIWNRSEKKWFMFYTNRRATDTLNGGVSWVHGTDIGIAESKDGANWKYREVARINYKPNKDYTYWAPEVIEAKGGYHMYLTYVPGIFKDWQHSRNMLHLTSHNLLDWKYESTLKLVNDRVIDACVIRKPNGKWRMWYNNEKDAKSIFYADSDDLYNWTDGQKAISDQRGEGPKVFKWKDKYWMITDVWAGLAVYSSDDLNTWKRQEGPNLLAEPGRGTDDGVKGGHCDVRVSSNGRAYLYYFVHPGYKPDEKSIYQKQRTSLQVVELKYRDGKLSCNRDEPTYLDLKS